MLNDYYVYVYLDPRKPGSFTYGDLFFDFEPFYIGEGRGDRDTQHLRDLFSFKGKKKTHKNNTLKAIVRQNLTPVILHLHENLSQAEAWRKEVERISLIGRHCVKEGPLTNTHLGGHGGAQPDEIRKQAGLKIAQRWKEGAYKNKVETPMSEEQKEKLRQAHLGKKQTPEQVARRFEARAGYQHSEETKRRIQEGQDKELHAEQSYQSWQNPEIRQARSEGIAKAWAKRKSQGIEKRIWIHKEEVNMCCEELKASQLLQEGWSKGRLKLKKKNH